MININEVVDVLEIVKKYRMIFIKLSLFDNSCENNFTRGISTRLQGEIICNVDEQCGHRVRRNHPQVLQQLHSVFIIK